MLTELEFFNSARFKQAENYIMPGSGIWVKPGYEAYYQSAYQLWHETIVEGMLSEGLVQEAQKLLSDDFLRQNEIHCIFSEKKAIGLFAFSWMDLHYAATRQQSYFKKNYPEFIVDQIQAKHRIVMTMGQLMIHPAWRKSKIGPGVADILMGFAVTRFLESPASLLITFTRNNRKTHELCYRVGGKPLLKEFESHSVASDIIVFEKKDVVACPIEGIQEAVTRLWMSKINISLAPELGYYL